MSNTLMFVYTVAILLSSSCQAMEKKDEKAKMPSVQESKPHIEWIPVSIPLPPKQTLLGTRSEQNDDNMPITRIGVFEDPDKTEKYNKTYIRYTFQVKVSQADVPKEEWEKIISQDNKSTD
jgi:hypothetical protein